MGAGTPGLASTVWGISEPLIGGGATVPISGGGTGQTTAAAALAALGGAAVGSHVVKTGDAGGNVSFTSATQAKLFGTQLDITQVVPVGMLALAICAFSSQNAGSQDLTAGIAVDGVIQAAIILGGGTVAQVSATALAVLVGDGASHVFSPQGAVSGGTFTLLNSTNISMPLVPMHVLLLLGAT